MAFEKMIRIEVNVLDNGWRFAILGKIGIL